MDNLFPIKFSKSEYNKQLGVYQKWISGNPNQKIERIYSMSAFQYYDRSRGFIIADYQKYAEYLLISVESIIQNAPDWYIRVYIDNSIMHQHNKDRKPWVKTFDKLLGYSQVQIVAVKFPRYYMENDCHQELLPVMFRYLTLFDPNVSIILFRDIDNVYTHQHQYFIDRWLERGDEMCFFMNDKYRRQQIGGLADNGDVILEDVAYTTIFGGVWSIRKPMGSIFSTSIWQKLFAYIEEYAQCTTITEYRHHKNYKIKFIYGFDELSLSRVAVPIFLAMGFKSYVIPTRIYDVDFINNMFLNEKVQDLLLTISSSETLGIVYNTIIKNYWDLDGPNSGLAQYMVCILTNIYYGIIAGKSRAHSHSCIRNLIKNEIMPSVLLMGIAVFTFRNHQKYSWYNSIDDTDIDNPTRDHLCGNDVVERYLFTNQRLTLADWSANTYISDITSEVGNISSGTSSDTSSGHSVAIGDCSPDNYGI
jgi:hypothetical protein